MSVHFEMSLWCHRFGEIVLKISALVNEKKFLIKYFFNNFKQIKYFYSFLLQPLFLDFEIDFSG